MKHVKRIGLAAVAAAALIAFVGAGTASATVVCSAQENPCSGANKWPAGTVIAATLKTTGKLVTTDEKTTLDTCTGSTIEGRLTSTGSATTTPSGPVELMTWTGCTFTTKTIQTGGLEIHSISGTHNGTVTTTGEFRITINTVLFGSCVFGVTSGTDLGELKEGNPAAGVVKMVAQKLSGSEAACPATALATGEYVQTKPSGTTVSIEQS